jgi:hypothetical protein
MLPTYEHTCRTATPVIANGQLDPNTTGVTSKNGQRPLKSATLAEIMTDYPDATPPSIGGDSQTTPAQFRVPSCKLVC